MTLNTGEYVHIIHRQLYSLTNSPEMTIAGTNVDFELVQTPLR
jgi:hypothetical protein